jgi:DNA-binding NarL/FixJ family response regulator
MEGERELEVVLVDDHVALRKGIELLLRNEGIRVTGSAESVAGGEEIILRSLPDVAIVDIGLRDGGNGVQLARTVLAERPDLGILLYTGGAVEQDLLREALASGARGFALKAGAPSELVTAIRSIAAGGEYVDPRVAALLDGRERSAVRLLSDREREILVLLAGGLTGDQIAEKLVLSPQTVQTHVRNLMRKLDAHTRVHALALALRHDELNLG